MIGNYDRTSYLENLGNGKFKLHELPWEAQIAPINRIVVFDYNEDGNDDLLLIGNDYGNEVFVGRYDAFNGSLLKGNGKGGFKVVSTLESGFLVSGDAKDMVCLKSTNGSPPYIIVSQNRDRILVFQKNYNNTD